MKESKYRIFISYRSGDESEKFAFNLYNRIKKDVDSEKKYGLAYYSKKEAPDQNYLKDIDKVMQDVEYFVIPYSKGYFKNFEKSTTYHEIKSALKFGVTFLCVRIGAVKFSDRKGDESVLRKLFHEDADSILYSKDLFFREEMPNTDIRSLLGVLCRTEYQSVSIVGLVQQQVPNIFLTFKRETEDNINFPLYSRLDNVKRLFLMNFAGTAFISSGDVSTAYKQCDELKDWFEENLKNGNIEANIIVTRPNSYAARDAALYKMNPGGHAKLSKDEIIRSNLNKIVKFRNEEQKADISIYTTDIALPYGIMLAEHDDVNEDFMKIDLYAPCVEDGKRPSFYLLRKNESTREMYNFFEDNLKFVLRYKSYKRGKHRSIDFFGDRIIHRGKINGKVQEHTFNAFRECMDEGYPMEVDLLFLADDEVVVYRDLELSDGRMISDLEYVEIKRGNLPELPGDQIMCLQDFLDFVNGKVPILIEIKSNDYREDDDSVKRAEKVYSILRKYRGSYAVHSANPYVLKKLRELDVQIPLGQITLDFNKKQYRSVDEATKKMHEKYEFFDIFSPDFISYNVEDMRNKSNPNRWEVVKKAEELGIPLLLWTITSLESEEYAKYKHCTMIIEGAITYKA